LRTLTPRGNSADVRLNEFLTCNVTGTETCCPPVSPHPPKVGTSVGPDVWTVFPRYFQMYVVIVPDPAFEPAALNVQFSIVLPLLLVVMRQGLGVKLNEAVGPTGVLVVVELDELVEVDVDVEELVVVDDDPPPTVVVVLVVLLVVVEDPTGIVVVVVVVETDVVPPTTTTMAAAFALVPQAFRLRSLTK
jgi:hypothetical protein